MQDVKVVRISMCGGQKLDVKVFGHKMQWMTPPTLPKRLSFQATSKRLEMRG